MKPKISFDVKLNEKNNDAYTMINNLPEDEINKQFLSLLLLNSFQPLPGLVKENSLDNNKYDINVGKILAGQMDLLFSMLSNNFEVNLQYKKKTQTNSVEIKA